MSGPFPQPINAATRYCAVYGFPVKHSASPVMHNAGLATLGLNWRYLACEVPPGDLRPAIAGARAMNFIGLNLTVPHKLPALDMMDALDASAQTWGAVNTVRFEGRASGSQWLPLATFADPPRETRAHGFNTDAEAITRSLRSDLQFEPRGSRVLLLGAGGAGRTAAFKLACDGVAELFIVNRTADRAVALARELSTRFPSVRVATGYPNSGVELLLNATSPGLRPEDLLPLDTGTFPLTSAARVYDMIYRPAETPLLRAARAAGCQTANGLGMLLYQGAAALELWTGQAAPLEVMRQALQENVYGEPDV